MDTETIIPHRGAHLPILLSSGLFGVIGVLMSLGLVTSRRYGAHADISTIHIVGWVLMALAILCLIWGLRIMRLTKRPGLRVTPTHIFDPQLMQHPIPFSERPDIMIDTSTGRRIFAIKTDKDSFRASGPRFGTRILFGVPNSAGYGYRAYIFSMSLEDIIHQVAHKMRGDSAPLGAPVNPTA